MEQLIFNETDLSYPDRQLYRNIINAIEQKNINNLVIFSNYKYCYTKEGKIKLEHIIANMLKDMMN